MFRLGLDLLVLVDLQTLTKTTHFVHTDVRNVGAQPSSGGGMPNRESLLRSTIAGSMTGAVNGAFSETSFIDNMTSADIP